MIKNLLLVGALAIAACNNTFDCDNICTKYHDCVDTTYDVTACRNRCESNSSNSGFSNLVNTCKDCINGQTCGGAAFACTSACNTIVP